VALYPNLQAPTTTYPSRLCIAELTEASHNLLAPAPPPPRVPTTLQPQGLEIHYATNFYGHFILTQLLLPNLLASAAAAATYVAGRVVVITSQLHGLVQRAGPDYTYSSLPLWGTVWGWIAYCR
jgi:NAD(P)-dependent dehydrogenase (short-subunit alcohol dehydrogenase family)